MESLVLEFRGAWMVGIELVFEEVFDVCIVDGNGVSGGNETDEKDIYENIMTYKWGETKEGYGGPIRW